MKTKKLMEELTIPLIAEKVRNNGEFIANWLSKDAINKLTEEEKEEFNPHEFDCSLCHVMDEWVCFHACDNPDKFPFLTESWRS